jgi:aminoglycoside phosphotransferase (APT) family kinase protein
MGAWERFRRAAEDDPSVVVLGGLNHRNHRLVLWDELAADSGVPPGTLVKVRVRVGDEAKYNALVWPGESVLDALAGSVADAPIVLARGAGFSVQTFTEGVPFSHLHPYGSEVPETSLKGIGDLFRQLAAAPLNGLPALPDGWPASPDSEGFLRKLVAEATRRCQDFQREYGSLFARLGVSTDLWTALAERIGGLTPRPYSLLHGDLHRGNILVTPDGEQRLALIDWELAAVGDPVYELATHLCRMHYTTPQERQAAERTWAAAVEEVRPEAVEGLQDDLALYVCLERLQSVFNDIVRAAQKVRGNQLLLEEEAGRVARTLAAARAEGVIEVAAPAEKVSRVLKRLV